MGQDYYKVLGVDRGATDEQLRAAYKKQAVKWHPDKNMNQREAAEERFKLIAEAYDVLSDPQKRAVYDRYGEDGLKGNMPQTPSGGGSSSSGAAGGPSFSYSGVDADMARNLFESLFGGAGLGGFGLGGMPGSGHASASGPGGASFQFMSTGPGGQFMSTGPGGTMFSTGPGGSGSSNPFNIHTNGGGNGSNRRRWASAFGGDNSDEEMFTAGTPGANPFAAHNMGPNGFFQQQQQPGSSDGWGGSSARGRFGGFGQQQQQQQPPKAQLVSLPLTLEELYSGCTKRLKVTRHVMDAASSRSFPVQEVMEIAVRPGWKEGTRITFAGKGDETAPGTAADLVFVVKQQPHARFERKGNDLHTRVKLPLVTALTGGSANVTMPDGRSLSLPISAPPVQPGATRLVVSEGMPISKGGKGDLHITFDVVFPTQLSSQQKAQLRHILPAA